MDVVSIQEAKYKTQSILGAITDSIGVGIAKFKHSDEGAALGVAIIKATRQDEAVPKEKHVRALVDACLGAPPASALDFVILGLFKRLEENAKTWLVTLKTLIVFHRLVREADPSFQVEVLRHGDGTGRPRLFCLGTFADSTTKVTSDYSVWIRAYSSYLDERLDALRATRFDPARHKAGTVASAFTSAAATPEAEEMGDGSHLKNLSSVPVADLLLNVACLERLLETLVTCVPEGAARDNEVTLLACALVLQELPAVYHATNEAVRDLVDRTFLMAKADAEKAVELISAYKALTVKLAAFVAVIGGIPALRGAIQLPTLEPLPDEVVTKVKEYAKDAPKEAPKPPSASPPSMADLLGFASFIVVSPPVTAAAAASAAGAAAGGDTPAAAGGPAGPPAAFDPFTLPESPKPPADPLDKVFCGALEALTLAATTTQEREGPDSAAVASPAAAAVDASASPSAAAPAAAEAAAAERSSATLSPSDSAVSTPAAPTTAVEPQPATIGSVATVGTAQPYSLKPNDPLDFISKELFGDRTPPPPKPMGKPMAGSAKNDEASPVDVMAVAAEAALTEDEA
ncbi:hypothetical protein PLESTF_000111300 [Pleodorina starrii]|nr:hypothetical protein PLESTM_001277000 [Pleodorina starrii]GLC64035.1 hypothetical protein PLESTF_000111300 [Pleodorina starrii]